MGSLRLKDNKDEDLALFREMRKREKERNDLLLLQNSDEFDAPLGPKTGSSPIFNITTGTPAPVRKTGADDFSILTMIKMIMIGPTCHKSKQHKFFMVDYSSSFQMLLTPPGTPLFPSLEMESQKTVMSQLGTPKARPTALKSRVSGRDIWFPSF
ncbi:UNVERIFIED_CONTAM: hypothetical protein Slati_4150300 [Sesamum latifolium]|uniref:Uncharacterized protein n=1 Tax=Sesamum latifolium TaxID=2727402 RepID=A0AAW2T8X4_9LAMI